jgi:hypothetical protein
MITTLPIPAKEAQMSQTPRIKMPTQRRYLDRFNLYNNHTKITMSPSPSPHRNQTQPLHKPSSPGNRGKRTLASILYEELEKPKSKRRITSTEVALSAREKRTPKMYDGT